MPSDECSVGHWSIGQKYQTQKNMSFCKSANSSYILMTFIFIYLYPKIITKYKSVINKINILNKVNSICWVTKNEKCIH